MFYYNYTFEAVLILLHFHQLKTPDQLSARGGYHHDIYAGRKKYISKFPGAQLDPYLNTNLKKTMLIMQQPNTQAVISKKIVHSR